MVQKVSTSKTRRKPARPSSKENFISSHSEIRILKKAGTIYVVEIIRKVSEIKVTTDNVIELPIRKNL